MTSPIFFDLFLPIVTIFSLILDTPMGKMVISFMDSPLVNKPEIPSSCGGHDVNSLYDCGKGKQFYETLKKEALFSPQHQG